MDVGGKIGCRQSFRSLDISTSSRQGTLAHIMPRGAPYHGFILPYSIRVDEFTGLPPDYPVAAKLYLLTHTHSDHLLGLSSKSFGCTVVCSEDAKQMLLRHEVFDERSMFEHGTRAEKRRTFKHLKVSPLRRKDGTVEHGGRDLLVRTLPRKFSLRQLSRNPSDRFPFAPPQSSISVGRMLCPSRPWMLITALVR